MGVGAETDRDQVGNVLQEGPVADRTGETPIVELSRVTAGNEVVA
jgi:hypothetical protein